MNAYSVEPKPTLLEVMGLNNMVKVAHGIGLRKTEIGMKDGIDAKTEAKPVEDSKELQQELQFLEKSHRIIMNALVMADTPQAESLSVEDTLLLTHALIDYDPSPERFQQALKFAWMAYHQADHERSPLLQQAQEDIQHVMKLMLAKLSKDEKEHYDAIRFMPEDSKCGVAHYKRLCLELTRLNVVAGNKERAQYWYTTTCILGGNATMPLPAVEAIDKELRDIISVVPDLLEKAEDKDNKLKSPPPALSVFSSSSSSSSSSSATLTTRLSSSPPASLEDEVPSDRKKESPT